MDKYLKYKKRYLELKKKLVNQKGGEYKFLKQPNLDLIPKTYDIMIQIRYAFKIIECYFLNTVFHFYDVEENNFTKKIFKNVCHVNLSKLEENSDDVIKDNTKEIIEKLVEDCDLYLPSEFRIYSQYINKEALYALYAIKHNFLHKDYFITQPTIKPHKNSIQNILFGKTIEKESNILLKKQDDGLGISPDELLSFNRNFVFIPKNIFTRVLLSDIRHYINSSIPLLEERLSYGESGEIDHWDMYQLDYNVHELMQDLLSFILDRIFNFFSDDINKLIKFYKENPSVELALFLAKLGIPSGKRFDNALNPPPDPKLRMTQNEVKHLKKFMKFVINLEKVIEEESNNLFTKYFDNITTKNPELCRKILPTKKADVYLQSGKTFKIDIDNSLTVQDLKKIICDYMNVYIIKAYCPNKNIYIDTPIEPRNMHLVFPLFGKLVTMEDERSISDYNMMGYPNPKINVVLKIKSGFKYF